MRLLKYDESSQRPSTYSFSLIVCNPPPYAILSHRWGADDDEYIHTLHCDKKACWLLLRLTWISCFTHTTASTYLPDETLNQPGTIYTDSPRCELSTWLYLNYLFKLIDAILMPTSCVGIGVLVFIDLRDILSFLTLCETLHYMNTLWLQLIVVLNN